jgi:uncharacterized protein YodC (DUF2158 family)
MAKFKDGETCRLNSGSPLMTVSSSTTDLGGKPVVNTTWFDSAGMEYSGQFGENMLEADDGTT